MFCACSPFRCFAALAAALAVERGGGGKAAGEAEEGRGGEERREGVGLSRHLTYLAGVCLGGVVPCVSTPAGVV